MSSYLPPTDDLPIFNPSVFQNDSTEGITLNEADTRYVKKSGSIMSGALSTPSLLVNSIDVETQLNKISSLETKTTDITFAAASGGNPAKTTIANSLDIDGVLSTQSIANLQTAIVANTAKTGITSSQSSAIVANSSKTGITSSQSSAIVANTAKSGGILGSVYVTWAQGSTHTDVWGADSRLDTLTNNYQKNGTISISENSTRDGAVDVGSGTYRVKVYAMVKPRQAGDPNNISISSERIQWFLYLSINNVTFPAFDIPIAAAQGYCRNLNSGNQGYGTNLSFEKLYYFSGTTELSIKTFVYSSNSLNSTGTFPNNNFDVFCTMVVERLSASDTQSYIEW